MRAMVLILFVLAAAIPVAGSQSPCRPKQHTKIPKIAKRTYTDARARLIAAGWTPLQTKSHLEAASDPDLRYGNGRVFWDMGYTEVDACAGTGVAPCTFYFADKFGNRLVVITAGEEDPQRKEHARVTGTRFECE